MKTPFWMAGLFLPTLLLFSGRLFSSGAAPFDEGYLSSQGQLWIRYHSYQKKSFEGVWSTSLKQVSVNGLRERNHWSFQVENEKWQGVLLSSESCELVLTLWQSENPEKKINLKSNYCFYADDFISNR